MTVRGVGSETVTCLFRRPLCPWVAVQLLEGWVRLPEVEGGVLEAAEGSQVLERGPSRFL